MRFTVIFTISFFTIALLLGVIESFYYQNSLEKIRTQDVFSHLEMVTKLKVKQIDQLLKEMKSKDINIVLNKDAMSRLAKITENTEGLLDNGEVYVINKNGYLLTPSRFLNGENKGVLTQKMNNKSSLKCLSGVYGGDVDNVHNVEKEKVMIFEDYRGEKVLGYHEYLSEVKWCVVSKIDKSQIFGSGDKTSKPFAVIILTIYAVAFVGFLFGRYLDKKYKLKKR